MTNKTTNAVSLTPREVELFCLMCQSFNSKPDINMPKFQVLSGLAESTAKHKINKLLRKAKGADTATPETGKKSRGRKRKAAAEDGSDDAADEGKASKTKKSKRDTANDETERDGEGENGGDNDVATSEVEDAGTDELA